MIIRLLAVPSLIPFKTSFLSLHCITLWKLGISVSSINPCDLKRVMKVFFYSQLSHALVLTQLIIALPFIFPIPDSAMVV